MVKELEKDRTVNEQPDIPALTVAWQTLVANLGPLKPPDSPKAFSAVVDVLDSLLDATHGDEDHPLSSLVDLVAALVAAYEDKNLQEPVASPAEVLRLLIQGNNLKQTDLALEIGGQSVVSQLLSGKRDFNARQARALASRFGVSPILFIGGPSALDKQFAVTKATVNRAEIIKDRPKHSMVTGRAPSVRSSKRIVGLRSARAANTAASGTQILNLMTARTSYGNAIS